MSATFDLPTDTIGWLQAEAERRRITIEDLLVGIACQFPDPLASGPLRDLSFVAIGASTSGRRAAEADEMLAEGFGRR